METLNDRDAILAALKRREETLVAGGRTVTIRELHSAAEAIDFTNKEDATYLLVVRCVFAADGKPVFTDDDIPALKDGAKGRFWPFIEAVMRVNGEDVRDNEKKSAPQPSA